MTHVDAKRAELERALVRDRFNEGQGETEREQGYRKGWNDHALHMLRLLAAREAQ